MNLTLWMDEQLVSLRTSVKFLVRRLNQMICSYGQNVVGNDQERSIREFRQLSGRGHSRKWDFDRNEVHNRSWR